MRGKAYRRLLSARRRPLLVLLLVVVVLVVWRVTVVAAPRWLGVEVLGLLFVSVLVCLVVIFRRDRRPAVGPPLAVLDDKWDWVEDPEFRNRLAQSLARQARR